MILHSNLWASPTQQLIVFLLLLIFFLDRIPPLLIALHVWFTFPSYYHLHSLL